MEGLNLTQLCFPAAIARIHGLRNCKCYAPSRTGSESRNSLSLCSSPTFVVQPGLQSYKVETKRK